MALYSGETMTPERPAEEPVKEILECTDRLLDELREVLWSIDTAIFSPRPQDSAEKEESDESLLATLRRQRGETEKILQLAVHIRGGLW